MGAETTGPVSVHMCPLHVSHTWTSVLSVSVVNQDGGWKCH